MIHYQSENLCRLKSESLIIDNQIDYNRLTQTELFNNEYMSLATQLKNINLNLLQSDDQKLAFFISKS
jgi:hypothetical protein